MTITNNHHEVGTTVHVAPDSLLINRNIREAKPDTDLVRSVKDLGVLEPITAVLTADGALLVRYGHRRTLAAIEAQRPTVPVYVAGHDSAEKAARFTGSSPSATRTPTERGSPPAKRSEWSSS